MDEVESERSPPTVVVTFDAPMRAPSSAKILHQHEIAAALIHLRKEDRASVWRDGQARVRWREGLVQRGDGRHFAGREVEEFNDRANGLIRRGKVDPFLGNSPKAPIASF